MCVFFVFYISCAPCVVLLYWTLRKVPATPTPLELLSSSCCLHEGGVSLQWTASGWERLTYFSICCGVLYSIVVVCSTVSSCDERY